MGAASFRNRVAFLREKLDKLPVDAIWILQPENRRYLSGFKATDGQLTESSGSLLVTKAESLLVTDSRYTTEAEHDAVDFEVVTLKKGFVEGIPKLLSRLGTRNLGFEENHVTWGAHHELGRAFGKLSPPLRLTPLKGLVEDMREMKDAEEIRVMEASADIILLFENSSQALTT